MLSTRRTLICAHTHHSELTVIQKRNYIFLWSFRTRHWRVERHSQCIVPHPTFFHRKFCTLTTTATAKQFCTSFVSGVCPLLNSSMHPSNIQPRQQKALIVRGCLHQINTSPTTYRRITLSNPTTNGGGGGDGRRRRRRTTTTSDDERRRTNDDERQTTTNPFSNPNFCRRVQPVVHFADELIADELTDTTLTLR